MLICEHVINIGNQEEKNLLPHENKDYLGMEDNLATEKRDVIVPIPQFGW